MPDNIYLSGFGNSGGGGMQMVDIDACLGEYGPLSGVYVFIEYSPPLDRLDAILTNLLLLLNNINPYNLSRELKYTTMWSPMFHIKGEEYSLPL